MLIGFIGLALIAGVTAFVRFRIWCNRESFCPPRRPHSSLPWSLPYHHADDPSKTFPHINCRLHYAYLGFKGKPWTSDWLRKCEWEPPQ